MSTTTRKLAPRNSSRASIAKRHAVPGFQCSSLLDGRKGVAIRQTSQPSCCASSMRMCTSKAGGAAQLRI
jgi:hypothetical protein